jgi:hypothetical protein
MRPKCLVLATALGLSSFHGGCSLYVEDESCPVAECDSSVHTFRCNENKLMFCTPVSELINDSATVCPTVDVWATSDDCEAKGAECVADAFCALEGVRCPPGTLGFCEAGRILSCEDERVRPPSSCYAEGTSCLEVTRPDGQRRASCELPGEPFSPGLARGRRRPSRSAISRCSSAR